MKLIAMILTCMMMGCVSKFDTRTSELWKVSRGLGSGDLAWSRTIEEKFNTDGTVKERTIKESINDNTNLELPTVNVSAVSLGSLSNT